MSLRLRVAMSFLAAAWVAVPLLAVMFINMASVKDAVQSGAVLGVWLHLLLTGSLAAFVFSAIFWITGPREAQ